ncbi:PIN domain-containing protein [Desulfonauticus submarinus]
MDDKNIQKKLYQIIDVVMVVPLTLDIVRKSWEIKEKYKFSYWDSLIVASALENNCSILYTEDMQDGQIIEKKLEIVNPFK